MVLLQLHWYLLLLLRWGFIFSIGFIGCRRSVVLKLRSRLGGGTAARTTLALTARLISAF